MTILEYSPYLVPLIFACLLVFIFLFLPWNSPSRSKSAALVPLPPYGRVVSDSAEISFHRESDIVESIARDSIDRIRVLTTPDGPFLPDVFWVFETGDGPSLKIPSEAEGMAALADSILELPNFRSDVFTQAMGSTEYAIFEVWNRPAECF